MKQTIERPVELELSADELQLIQAGLRLLLVVEDDHITIERLKDLIGRIDREFAAVTLQAGTRFEAARLGRGSLAERAARVSPRASDPS
jgi:hypothetical protein